MFAFYCPTCDRIIIHPGKSDAERPTHHYHKGVEHALHYMKWFHPEWRMYEVEAEIRQQLETFGVSDQPQYVFQF
jgi:hypothetical protein